MIQGPNDMKPDAIFAIKTCQLEAEIVVHTMVGMNHTDMLSDEE